MLYDFVTVKAKKDGLAEFELRVGFGSCEGRDLEIVAWLHSAYLRCTRRAAGADNQEVDRIRDIIDCRCRVTRTPSKRCECELTMKEGIKWEELIRTTLEIPEDFEIQIEW